MVPVAKQLCPSSKYYMKCPRERNPKFIIVHNTGNDAPAKNEVTYMINNDNYVSFHYAVDDKEVRQGIPDNRIAYGCDDNYGNTYGIQIEICYSLSGGPDFDKAERNAAEFIACKLKEYGWGIDKVTKHEDYNGKYCPHRTLDLGWDRFLKMIESYMKEEEVVTYEEWKEYMDRYNKEQKAKPASKYAEESWEKATEKKLLDGTMPRSPLTREQFAAVMDRMGVIDSHDTK